MNDGRQTLAVAICTYNRNEALTTLLGALRHCVAEIASEVRVGVVIVDDSADGKARTVAEQFSGQFELGVAYRISGRQNISLARNLAISTASEMAEWIAMTDDDCEPDREWLKQLLDVQRSSGADAVTGPMIRRVPEGSPKWLTDEPFLMLGVEPPEPGAELTVAATNNSLISAAWLRNHPAIRFRPDLGIIGGEDMVFYNAAYKQGLRIRYAARAVVHENETAARATLAYQLRLFFWLGNNAYITNVRNGVSPGRMLLNGANSLQRALVRPFARLLCGERPQLRYCLASVLKAAGTMLAYFGLRVPHR